MKIELRDIITRSELATWKEMSTLGDDASAYEDMIARWQKDFDKALATLVKQKKEQSRLMNEHIRDWVRNIGPIVVVVLFVGFAINSCMNQLSQFEAARAVEKKKNIEAGLFPFGIRTGNQQIKDAPVGVTLAAMEAEDTSGAFNPSAILRYTLNLPKLSENQVYAVAHELIDGGKVVGTGLFYTNPGEHGLSRFEKKVDASVSNQEFDWLKITVRVVDAGSVPKKE